MSDTGSARSFDVPMVRAWLTARSVARGLPAPVEDGGGWRVDTNLPDEVCRYVFVDRLNGLAKIAHALHRPRIFLKLFGSEETMRPLLPSRWQIGAGSFFMTLRGETNGPPPLPRGYRMEMAAAGQVIEARIRTLDGTVAAAGFAAETEDAFVYDRIVTNPSHRRRGLARAVMNALGAARRSANTQQVLVATDEGRALYSTMGWIVRSPWTTASIPGA